MSAWIRKEGIGLIALVLIGAVAFYAYYDRHIRYFQETNDAKIEADQVTISSKLSGYVRSVGVSDNQPVTKGALLAEIDPKSRKHRPRKKTQHRRGGGGQQRNRRNGNRQSRGRGRNDGNRG